MERSQMASFTTDFQTTGEDRRGCITNSFIEARRTKSKKKTEMEPADTTLEMETYGLNCDPMDDANFICLDILLAEQAMHVS